MDGTHALSVRAGGSKLILVPDSRWWVEGSRYELAVTVDDIVVGLCGFTVEEPALPIGDVGYWILERHRGQGLAAAALSLMTRWALDAGVIQTLVCRVAPTNVASRRTAERAGYRLSGRRETVHGRDLLLLVAETDGLVDPAELARQVSAKFNRPASSR